MARLLKNPEARKLSKPEASGKAFQKLQEKGHLSIPMAADYFQLHKYTVRDYVEKGFIRSILIGSRKVIPQDECMRVAGLLRIHGSLAAALKALENEQGEVPHA